MKPKYPSITNLERRLNHIDYGGHAMSGAIDNAKEEGWPDHAVLPFIKERARLRREYTHVSGLIEKRKQEREEARRVQRLEALTHKFNDRRK